MGEEVEKLLSPLDEREREILRLRYGLDRGDPRTLEEVGDALHLTRERIRQIERQALSKLRHPSTESGRARPAGQLTATGTGRPAPHRVGRQASPGRQGWPPTDGCRRDHD